MDETRWTCRSDELRRNLRTLLNSVERDAAHVTVLRYDKPAAVIVPVEWYEQMTRGTPEPGKCEHSYAPVPVALILEGPDKGRWWVRDTCSVCGDRTGLRVADSQPSWMKMIAGMREGIGPGLLGIPGNPGL